MLRDSVKKGQKKLKQFQSTDPKVDPGFLDSMGYRKKKKKKGK
jgi:hypothetical protein